MAYVSRLSDYVRGGIAGQDLQEGLPATITNSGSVNELPVALAASTGQVNNVFIAFVPPDDFARPTEAGMYTARNFVQFDSNKAFTDPVQTRTYYEQGKSTLWNPTVASGERVLLQRGGTYAVPSGTFNDSATMRTPGTLVRVGANGRWDYTTDQAVSVGVVEEYNTANGVLIFTLWH